MRFLPASDTALLVELADLDHALALYRAAQAQPIAGVQELVPAARTLLVHYRPEAIAPATLVAALRQRAAAAPERWAVLREWGFRGLGSLPPEVLRETCVDAATRRADVVTAAQMQAVVDVFGGAGRTSSGR